MPEDYELYYGFTRFAMELNELDPDLSNILPPTDTRFRPDQRWALPTNLYIVGLNTLLYEIILLAWN